MYNSINGPPPVRIRIRTAIKAIKEVAWPSTQDDAACEKAVEQGQAHNVHDELSAMSRAILGQQATVNGETEKAELPRDQWAQALWALPRQPRRAFQPSQNGPMQNNTTAVEGEVGLHPNQELQFALERQRRAPQVFEGKPNLYRRARKGLKKRRCCIFIWVSILTGAGIFIMMGLVISHFNSLEYNPYDPNAKIPTEVIPEALQPFEDDWWDVNPPASS